jgi:Integrase core domain
LSVWRLRLPHHYGVDPPDDVLAQLEELFLFRGTPDHIRSDNGPEFTAQMVRGWLARLEVKTLFITPGSPWENGYVESFNCRLKLFLKGEIFDTLREAQIVIEQWRVHYNTVWPHSSLGYRPPAPETATGLLPSPRKQRRQKSVTLHLVRGMGADQIGFRFSDFDSLNNKMSTRRVDIAVSHDHKSPHIGGSFLCYLNETDTDTANGLSHKHPHV